MYTRSSLEIFVKFLQQNLANLYPFDISPRLARPHSSSIDFLDSTGNSMTFRTNRMPSSCINTHTQYTKIIKRTYSPHNHQEHVHITIFHTSSNVFVSPQTINDLVSRRLPIVVSCLSLNSPITLLIGSKKHSQQR